MTRSTAFRNVAPWIVASGLAIAVAAPARAEDPPAAPAAPTSWASSIKLTGQIEAGANFAASSPKTNFGQLFTDKPNTATLNQILLTAARTIDPKETGWDVGFKLQLLYGSDARYTHFMGLLDHVTNDRYQLDVVEANITVHAPIITDGGVDLKIGAYPTPLGFETIDPSTNPFYSHSYIFNFGIPLKHTGAMAILHANDVIDLYGGIDTGVNTTFGKYGDNNGAMAGLFGFNLTLLDGNLTVLALSHIGAENPSLAVPNADNYLRYLNDVMVTYKVNEKLTLVTEFNYIRDDFAKASGGGVAQYVAYALTDTLTLNGRAEIWNDDKGFFVASFPGNTDFVNSELGKPATLLGNRGGTYSEFTAGVTYKPDVPAPLTGLQIRPEVRYDRALSSFHPFNGGKDQGAFTLAADFVLGF